MVHLHEVNFVLNHLICTMCLPFMIQVVRDEMRWYMSFCRKSSVKEKLK